MDAINWHSFFFLLFALVASCFAVAVVASANIVRMACYLIVSLSAVAGLFFLAGADFVGAMQLMVYVGGTLVLLVFGVMLTAQGPHDTLYTGGGQWILAIAAGFSLLAILIQTAFSVSDWSQPPKEQIAITQAVDTAALEGLGNTATPLGMGMLGIRTDSLEEQNATIRGGMSGYLLPFEIISVHLLVVLVGAAYLARAGTRKRDRGRKAEGKGQKTVDRS